MAATFPLGRFIEPRLEVELRLHHGSAAQGTELHDLRCAGRDGLCRALTVEIVDLRTMNVDPETKKGRTVIDNIADNAANAALVMGGRPFKPDAIDMRWAACLCYRNGQIEESGVAAAVLNHPANGIAWLANKLAPFEVALEPGPGRPRRIASLAWCRQARGRRISDRLRPAGRYFLPLRMSAMPRWIR